ncbi:class I SAM-dependent methyltransferase [Archangium lansingense]|uniref:Methyltransferase domain-containing protein n=1 Tax=Archangium lansingense TaxID=2995310 RepID=A0ABT4A9Z7_9BACT|nr:methyltransferase domain-containing protein [Archangium lansinium]MCY1078488.1 methyltransferase domain-containing protein [Archangium lansinium]
MVNPDVREIYDELGQKYDVWTQLPDRLFLNGWRRELLAGAKGDVLEVAVGTGKNLGFYPEGCRVTGLDFSRSMLDEASRRAQALGRPFEAKEGDVTALPFADASFDTVSCTLAVCTFGDPLAALREMRRVCRPGGSVLLLEHVLPRDRPLARFAQAVAPLARKAVGCNPNRDTLALLREAGLNVDSVRGRVRDIILTVVARP